MIRKRVPDKAKARSMIQAAESEIHFLKTITPSKESASTIIRGIYESFRMLGDALLIMRGKEAVGIDHHTEMIQELFTLQVQTKRPIQALSHIKNLRNRINYLGYLPSEEEARDALSLVEACFEPIVKEIKGQVEVKKITLPSTNQDLPDVQ